MIYATYKDLVVRFGDPTAYKLMQTIERLTQIQNEIVIPLNQEQRFHRALMALNDNNFAA